MGYRETFCHICGVTFNVSRLRTADEPRSAAWTRGWVGSFDPADSVGCDGTTGCSVVCHPVPSGYRGVWSPWDDPGYGHDDAITGEHIDPTYPPPSESSGANSNVDPLEYDSNASDAGLGSGSVYSDSDDSNDESANPGVGAEEWIFKVSHDGPYLTPPPREVFIPLDEAHLPWFRRAQGHDSKVSYSEDEDEVVSLGPGDERKVRKSLFYEHIAGPGCVLGRSGYLGHRICVGEMRGTSVSQCLALKGPDWQSEADDHGFERESGYYLTGLGVNMPILHYDLKVSPPRHGTGEVNPHLEHFIYSLDNDVTLGDIAFPFHTACFELFRQASMRTFGKVDIDGLMLFRKHTINRDSTMGLPLKHHQAVRNAQSQFWEYSAGDEWLVANPVLIPTLRHIVRAALDVGPNFDVEMSPFATRIATGRGVDIFSKLPRELVDEILQHLDSKDIAAMQLVSRVFTHLPISLWRRLIIQEMPWIYEAWSQDAEPYMWVTRDAQPLPAYQKAREKAAEEHERDQNARRTAMREEMLEIYEVWAADQKPFEWPPLEPSEEEVENTELRPVGLPYGQTNWFVLHSGIKKNWGALRGLRNRERIWDGVGQIIEQIQVARERDSVLD